MFVFDFDDIFSRTNAKYLIKGDVSERLFRGEVYRHPKPIFAMTIDRNGGGACRWKLHYTGCSKKDNTGKCLKVKEKLTVTEEHTQKVVSYV